jgi:hypothetical protein
MADLVTILNMYSARDFVEWQGCHHYKHEVRNHQLPFPQPEDFMHLWLQLCSPELVRARNQGCFGPDAVGMDRFNSFFLKFLQGFLKVSKHLCTTLLTEGF